MKAAGLMFACLLAWAPAAAGAQAQAQPAAFAEHLAEVEALRGGERAKFLLAFDGLTAELGSATTTEHERYRLLDAYRQLVFAKAFDAGLREAEALLESASDPSVRYRAAALVANGYGVTGDYVSSLRALNVVVAMRHSVADLAIRNDGINVAATVYNVIGQHRIALGYAEESLASDLTPRQRCVATLEQLGAQQRLGLLHDEKAIVRGIGLCEEIGDMGAHFVRLTHARYLIAEGRQAEAVALLDRNLAAVEAFGYPYLIADFHALRAEAALAQGDLDAAAADAAAILPYADRRRDMHSVVTAHRIMAEVAEARGDTALALRHHKAYLVAERGRIDEIQARETAYQLVRQETNQKAQQLDAANRQNELLSLRQRVQQQTTQNDRLLILLLLLMLVSAAVWAWRARRMQASLRRLAETDPLTGTCNRRHFTAGSERLLEQASRAGDDAALVMFDLDHFKLVNDRFGHAAGDWVLRRVAEVCRAECGPADLFGRLGGEEFAILLPGATTRDARRVAEACRLRLAGIDSGETGHAFRVTASFGASGTALSGYELARLLSHADKMLYRAKREGRNRVFAYEVPDPLAAAPTAAGVADAVPRASADTDVARRAAAS